MRTYMWSFTVSSRKSKVLLVQNRMGRVGANKGWTYGRDMIEIESR